MGREVTARRLQNCVIGHAWAGKEISPEEVSMYAHDRGLARASLSIFDDWQGAGWHRVAVVVGSGSLLN